MEPPQQITIKIRPMTGEDLDQVISIDKMSFTLPWPPSSYRFELYENPVSHLWVAEGELPDGEKQIVGAVVVWLILDEAHIATFAVHPHFRGQGIGRKLMTETMRECIRLGAVSATLEVRVSNEIAQNLYRDFGFEVVNRRARYYADNHEDALLMTVADLGEDYLEWLEDL